MLMLYFMLMLLTRSYCGAGSYDYQNMACLQQALDTSSSPSKFTKTPSEPFQRKFASASKNSS